MTDTPHPLVDVRPDDGPPPAPPPRRPRRRWLIVVVVVAALLGVGLVAASSIELSYYAVGPGPVEDVGGVVSVRSGADTFAADGDFYFLTVILEEVNVLEYLDAALNPEVDLRPRADIRPDGVSPEQLQRANRESMQESQERAIFVALTRLGYDATLTGEGALVVGLVEGSPAEGLLQTDDVIIGFDGEDISLAGDAVAQVTARRPGDRVTLTVLRAGEDGEDEEVEASLVLGENPDDSDRGFIGVYLDTLNRRAEFPIEVEINAGNIGGPSAGLMYALGILNLLTEDDLTRGYQIAGTGTIQDPETGAVGPIGGIRQKVYAAIDSGAEFVLVPEGNYDDARDAAGEDVTVVSIATFDDALDFLRALEPNSALAAQAGG